MRTLRTLRAADVMTRSVFPIPSRTTIKDAAQMLLSRHFSGAPVIDATRNCIGVVSLRDIARYQQVRGELRNHDYDFYSSTQLEGAGSESLEFVVERDPNETVERIMSPLVLAVEEDAPIAEVIRLILHHRVHRIFVMDDDRHLVGIVSTVDILGAILPSLEATARPRNSVEPPGSARKPSNSSRRRPKT